MSTRTVERDILSLRESGVPIMAMAGPDDGYVLGQPAALPPVSFTDAEATAVAVALAALDGSPFAREGEAAMQKVMDALGVSSRESFEELARQFWLNTSPAPRSPVTAVIEEGLRECRVIIIDYTDAAGVTTTGRRVEPQLLGFTDGHWYLLGWCLERQGPRWFRWDRISRAVPTQIPARPRDTIRTFGLPPAAPPAGRRPVGEPPAAPQQPEQEQPEEEQPGQE